MRNRRTAAALLSLSALAAGAAALTLVPAQPEHEIATTPLADHPAAKMVGLWRGTVNAMGRDGRWHEGRGVERVRWNLAGTALIVEGYGYGDDPETGERTVGHDAFGLIEHDAETGAVRFHARRAGASFQTHTLEADSDGALRWSPSTPEGSTVRFTIKVDDERWHEVGEMSRDGGQTWNKFIEVDLARVNE